MAHRFSLQAPPSSHTALKRALTVACYLLVINTVEAAQLKFSKGTDLPGIGLRLKMMSNAREMPLPSPTAFTYVESGPNSGKKVEMFQPYELWISDQHAGEWADKHDNTLILAVIRRPWVGGFSREHLTSSEFALKKGEDPAPDSWNLEELEQWLSAFSRQDSVKGSYITRPPTRFSSLVLFEFQSNERDRIAYAFRLNPKALGHREAASDWFLALFTLGSKTDLKAAHSEIRRRFLSTITAAPTGSGKAHEGPSRKFQSRHSSPGDEVSKEFKESRDRVARSIENMKDWWYVETRHYILLSDLNNRYRRTLRDLQDNLELLRASLEDFMPPQKPISVVSVVRAFATDKEYEEYVGPQHEWTSGIWHPARKELVIRSRSESGGRQEQEQFSSVVYHEAFHQYIYYALDQTQTSPWFNEGHAAFFASAEFSNRGVRIREDKSRVSQLKKYITSDDADIEAIMDLSYDEFYGTSSAARWRNYTLSWALVYYLLKGVALESHSPYDLLLDRYLGILMETGSESKATAEILIQYDVQTLEHDMTKFWKSSSRRAQADRYRLLKRD